MPRWHNLLFFAFKAMPRQIYYRIMKEYNLFAARICLLCKLIFEQQLDITFT